MAKHGIRHVRPKIQTCQLQQMQMRTQALSVSVQVAPEASSWVRCASCSHWTSNTPSMHRWYRSLPASITVATHINGDACVPVVHNPAGLVTGEQFLLLHWHPSLVLPLKSHQGCHRLPDPQCCLDLHPPERASFWCMQSSPCSKCCRIKCAGVQGMSRHG
jgi:hypothetical protein